ncbi:MAG TPA: hypothetical protein VFK02_08445, partial [Kofleriaceae bacterium]|nr:hypothetical protein [Kofleriaceae bacterium]
LNPVAPQNAVEEPITDLLFYYIGHGHRAGDALFLTIQSTREANIEQSSWSTTALAQTLRQHAPNLRKHIVLDCCYGATAVGAFQRPDNAGVAVFYAAEKYSVALARPDNEHTLFTEAFIATTTSGISGSAPALSLEDLCNAMRPALQAHHTQPNVVDAAIRDIPVSGVGIFPNRTGAVRTSSELMRREMYSRMLELERRFDQRLARRNEQLQAEYEQKLAASALTYEQKLADSASRMRLLSSELQSKIDESGLQDVLQRTIDNVREEGPLTEARMLKKADQHGRKRALFVFLLGLGCVVAVLKLGGFGTILHPPDEIVVINPALGWQGPIPVKRDEQICITADGRVHLGLNQVVNVMNAARAIIARFADVNSETWRIAAKRDEQTVGNDKPTDELSKVRFRRPWSDPNGVQVDDELLNAAMLQIRCKWGQLVGIEVGSTDPLLSSRDPFAVLRDNDYTPDRVHCIGSKLELTVRRNGNLVFIVNDAVSSDVFPDRLRSRELYSALKKAAAVLPDESHHQRVIDVPSLPLFWYSDNGGQYTVKIRRGPCDDDAQPGGRERTALPVSGEPSGS